MLSLVISGEDAGAFCHQLLEVSSVLSSVGDNLVTMLGTDKYYRVWFLIEQGFFTSLNLVLGDESPLPFK